MVIESLYLAIGAGSEILRDNANIALKSSQAWGELYQSIFDTNSGVWLAVIYVAKQITYVAFIGFGFYSAYNLAYKRYDRAFLHVLWIVMMMVLLSKDGILIADFNLGWKEFTLERIEQVYKIQIGGVATQEAIKDTLVTGEVKHRIASKARSCEAKTGDAQLECIKDVGDFALKAIEDAEKDWGSLAGLERLRRRIVGVSDEAERVVNDENASEEDYNIVEQGFNVLLGSSLQAFVHLLAKICQWIFSNGIELCLLLTGLYAPLAVSLSTLPIPTRFLWAWLISNLVLSGTLWSYALMVGILAQFIAVTGLQDVADLDFLLFMGVFAPIASLVFVSGAGTAMWRSMTSSVALIARM